MSPTMSPNGRAIHNDNDKLLSELTIRRPDDMHAHLRDGAMLRSVAPFTAKMFGRAIVMPNLKPPVRNVHDAQAYSHRIMQAVRQSTLSSTSSFKPLMTLYLTDETTAEDIQAAHQSGIVHACKLYPAGATTNSAHGVTNLDNIKQALGAMQDCNMVLCVHGEVTGHDVDMFDREAEFVENVLPKLLSDFPRLRIVLEHVTTSHAVRVVQAMPAPSRLSATITAHHLLYSRQALFDGAKLHPHMFCLPVLKRESHRQALLDAIAHDTDGRFFAGTDSAPHPKDAKICPDACAGIFTAHVAIELYAEAFEQAGILHRLEAFASVNGARFYRIPLNEDTVTLKKQSQKVMDSIPVEESEPVVPLRAGQTVSWTVTNVTTRITQ